jgi:hypothetical protein
MLLHEIHLLDIIHGDRGSVKISISVVILGGAMPLLRL